MLFQNSSSVPRTSLAVLWYTDTESEPCLNPNQIWPDWNEGFSCFSPFFCDSRHFSQAAFEQIFPEEQCLVGGKNVPSWPCWEYPRPLLPLFLLHWSSVCSGGTGWLIDRCGTKRREWSAVASCVCLRKSIRSLELKWDMFIGQTKKVGIILCLRNWQCCLLCLYYSLYSFRLHVNVQFWSLSFLLIIQGLTEWMNGLIKLTVPVKHS